MKLKRWTLPALCCALLPALALAQAAADPTLPPPSLQAPGGAAAASTPATPELQSILVSREAGGRRVAVISGEMVRQGARFHGAVVERVGETEVILRRGKTREVLRLFDNRAAASATAPANLKKETQ